MKARDLHDDASSIASSSSSSSTTIEGSERPHSPTSLFEDSLFTLFSHNQPAHGDPGDTCKYTHPNLPSRYATSPDRPTTIRYQISQNSGTNTKLFAHHQWDAGLYLADLIAEQSHGGVAQGKQEERRFVDVRDKTVVELGAGTGLPGLVACVMGADRTVITDYPDTHVIDNLERNLDLALVPSRKGKERELNPYYTEARKRVQVLGLGWGNADEEARVLRASRSLSESEAIEGYDLVLAADVLWVSSAHPLLIHSIRKLLKRDRDARCALIAGFHTGRPAVRRFFLQLAQPANSDDAKLEQGRKGAIIPDWEEDTFGGLWERNIDGSRRPWSGAPMPCKSNHDANSYSDNAEDVGAEEEMGDISDRGSWVVVASLRWADLD
ncbi:hypothetical protein PHSY_003785 [Pseudozyma hubeiensis SY62]|uniref:Nicotinamide N-methyltransferase n=1 Tax=Pseudozyma hubeiensis (strain SY62) TaxID=1305764 RepID=R9PDN1_PSEHS|nr:hypothetical protein PHSY_003785 [Pseudozyma hubeiensis SY62]GAC96205.1 hypothetical protein PHSY_003785 [Pseudozyma hubeiensis SY62]